jgi:hypothetical protein
MNFLRDNNKSESTDSLSSFFFLLIACNVMESPNEMENDPDEIPQEILDLIPAEKPFKKSVNAIYSIVERDFFKRFKPSYILLTNSPARKQYFRTQMLAPIFNFWKKNGNPVKDCEESADRIKVLLSHSSSY